MAVFVYVYAGTGWSCLICRLSLVVPKGIHKAGFHPDRGLGGHGRGGGRRRRAGLDQATCGALGIAGSMAGGIIEYLAEGTWTKRMHPGWRRNPVCARRSWDARFLGPRTVFEGLHGLFHGFADSSTGDWGSSSGVSAQRWVTERLRSSLILRHDDPSVHRLRATSGNARDQGGCDPGAHVRGGEGTVHRLWEPLGAKQRRPTAMLGNSPYRTAWPTRFCTVTWGSMPSPTTHCGPDCWRLRRRSRYRRSAKPLSRRFHRAYPRAAADRGGVEERQPHLRGGDHEPLTRERRRREVLPQCRARRMGRRYRPQRAVGLPCGVDRRARPGFSFADERQRYGIRRAPQTPRPKTLEDINP